MGDPLYVQCAMRSGNLHDVAWIPEDCAKLDAKVSFPPDERLWTVSSVGTVKLPWLEVNTRSRDWKNTRKASDI